MFNVYIHFAFSCFLGRCQGYTDKANTIYRAHKVDHESVMEVCRLGDLYEHRSCLYLHYFNYRACMSGFEFGE